MEKTLVNFSIDADVAQTLRLKIPDRERSATVTNLLRTFLVVKDDTDTDEQALIDRITLIDDEQKRLYEEKGALAAQLLIIRNKRVKDQHQWQSKVEAMYDAVKTTNPMGR